MSKSPYTGQEIILPIVPVRDVMVNQPFGVNYLDFYKNLGMLGHNGIDFQAYDGCPVLAAHDGVVSWAGTDVQGGISVNLVKKNSGLSFYTLYYHLKDVGVKVGDKVTAGVLLGWADNTGIYTTGDHLHFGLKEIKDGGTINLDNGYRGAIDPAPYFPADWAKTNAAKRYGRKRAYMSEVKVMIALRAFLKRNPTFEEINSATYGAWDREAVKNPAMKYLWAYLTKGEYLAGKRPFV